MGLFDAFKKKDKKLQDDLDLPPPPPSIGNMDEVMPEFPDFDENQQAGSKSSGNDDFDFSKEQEIEDMKMPDFPKMPDFDDSMGQITAPADHIDGMDFDLGDDFDHDDAMKVPAPMPQPRQPLVQNKPQVPQQKSYAPAYQKPSAVSKPVSSSGSTYLKVDDFRLMLGTMASARSEIRKSEESLVKLETLKASKDKSFEKVKLSLEDIQKKLIFIDKTLFKGE